MCVAKSTLFLSTLDIPAILSYGVIGLGFLLALLSYRLLSKEQSRESPRRPIIISIYSYMLFSILICIVGLFGNLSPDNGTPKKQNLKSDLFLGTWNGVASDIQNEMESSSNNESYSYQIELKFLLNDASIDMIGKYTARPNIDNTPEILDRDITGKAEITNNEYLRIHYETSIINRSNTKGFGVMLLKFSPSGSAAKGYYIARSVEDGELVTGEIRLSK